jgi:methylglutaconyl-CoA hydratase
MMSAPLIRVETTKPAIALLTLARPDKRNALNMKLMTALCESMEALNRDESIRVTILRGEGAVFCSGLDLAEARDIGLAQQSAELVAQMLLAIRRSHATTIAAVHGVAIAGGAGLMTACDFVVAAEATRIGYPEVRRGLVASLVTLLLRRQIGERFARELLVLGELVDARVAREMGLVNRVVPKNEVLATAYELAAQVLKGAPGAIEQSRRHLDELWPRSFEEDLAQALEHHMRVRTSEEATEGMRAFTEKRLPNWDLNSQA